MGQPIQVFERQGQSRNAGIDCPPPFFSFTARIKKLRPTNQLLSPKAPGGAIKPIATTALSAMEQGHHKGHNHFASEGRGSQQAYRATLACGASRQLPNIRSDKRRLTTSLQNNDRWLDQRRFSCRKDR